MKNLNRILSVLLALTLVLGNMPLGILAEDAAPAAKETPAAAPETPKPAPAAPGTPKPAPAPAAPETPKPAPAPAVPETPKPAPAPAVPETPKPADPPVNADVPKPADPQSDTQDTPEPAKPDGTEKSDTDDKKQKDEAASAGTTDEEAAKAAETKLSAVSLPVYPASRETVAAARAAYDALTPEQKALVSASLTSRLSEAETFLPAADAIAALPEVNALTLDHKAAVEAAYTQYHAVPAGKIGNQKKLLDAYARIQAIPADQLIQAIGTVMPETRPAVQEARNAFNSLPAECQAMVFEYPSLEAAEAALNAAEKIAALPAQDAMTLADKPAVKQARAVYETLSDPAKTVLGNLPVLEAAEARILELTPYAVLKEAPEGLNAVFDGTEHSLTKGGKAEGGKLVYSFKEDGKYLPAVLTARNAGTYTLWYQIKADEDHRDTAPVSMEVTISPKPITVDVTIADKQYNGKSDAVIASAVLNGLEGSDEVTVVSGAAAFTGVDVKNGEAVTLTEFTLTGANAGNYVLTQPTGVTGNIVNNFTPTEGTEYTLSEPVTDWIGKDLKITPAAGFTLHLHNKADSPAAEAIVGDKEGKDSSLTFYVKNADGDISNPVTVTYSLDKSAPTVTGAEAGKTYYDARKIEIADGNLKKASLDGTDLPVKDGKASADLPGVGKKTEHLLAAEDTLGNRLELKFIQEPVSSLINETAGIQAGNLSRSHEQTLLDHIAAMEALKKSTGITAEDAASLDAGIAREKALVARIRSGALEAQAERNLMAAYDEKTVTSADRETIAASKGRMDALLKAGTLPAQDSKLLAAAAKKADCLLAVIDSTAAEMTKVSDILKAYETDTVKSVDRKPIEKGMKALEALLADTHLTETERKTLEGLKTHGTELLKRIQDAYDAVHTKEIGNTKGIHKNNVNFSHRADLEAARDQMTAALKTYAGNYTDWEKKDIEKDLERVKAAIWTLDRAATSIWMIDQLPAKLLDGDNRTMAAIEHAMRYYDGLSAHEMNLVGRTRYAKLKALYDSYIHYQIVPMPQDPKTADVKFQVTGDLKKFVELRIDNVKLEKDTDYTVRKADKEKNRIEIVLKESFLQTLINKKHEIEVDYQDGIAIGELLGRKVSSSWVPKTGDGFQIGLWAGTMVLSLAVLIILAVPRKKENK